MCPKQSKDPGIRPRWSSAHGPKNSWQSEKCVENGGKPANAWPPNQNTILWECRKGKEKKKENQKKKGKGKKKNRRKPETHSFPVFHHTKENKKHPQNAEKKITQTSVFQWKVVNRLWCNFFRGLNDVASGGGGWGGAVGSRCRRRCRQHCQRHNQNNKPQFTYTTPQPQSQSLRCRRAARFSAFPLLPFVNKEECANWRHKLLNTLFSIFSNIFITK